jgi:hypothetical protein
MFSRFLQSVCVGFVCLGGCSGFAQDGAVAGTRHGGALRLLAGAAGNIFAGTVMSVRHVPASEGNALGTVQITLRVMDAVRGPTAGHSFTMRQWSGLWVAGERYRVGERLLLFLYSPSKLGLTSPVAGQHGRFAMDKKGRVFLDGPLLEEVRTGSGTQVDVSASEANGPWRSGTRVSYREVLRAVQRAAKE